MNPTNHHITKACGKWSYYLCFLLAVLVTTTNWVHSWRLSNPLFSTRSITNQNIGYDKQHSWKSGSLLDKPHYLGNYLLYARAQKKSDDDITEIKPKQQDNSPKRSKLTTQKKQQPETVNDNFSLLFSAPEPTVGKVSVLDKVEEVVTPSSSSESSSQPVDLQLDKTVASLSTFPLGVSEFTTTKEEECSINPIENNKEKNGDVIKSSTSSITQQQGEANDDATDDAINAAAVDDNSLTEQQDSLEKQQQQQQQQLLLRKQRGRKMGVRVRNGRVIDMTSSRSYSEDYEEDEDENEHDNNNNDDNNDGIMHDNNEEEDDDINLEILLKEKLKTKTSSQSDRSMDMDGNYRTNLRDLFAKKIVIKHKKKREVNTNIGGISSVGSSDIEEEEEVEDNVEDIEEEEDDDIGSDSDDKSVKVVTSSNNSDNSSSNKRTRGKNIKSDMISITKNSKKKNKKKDKLIIITNGNNNDGGEEDPRRIPGFVTSKARKRYIEREKLKLEYQELSSNDSTRFLPLLTRETKTRRNKNTIEVIEPKDQFQNIFASLENELSTLPTVPPPPIESLVAPIPDTMETTRKELAKHAEIITHRKMVNMFSEIEKYTHLMNRKKALIDAKAQNSTFNEDEQLLIVPDVNIPQPTVPLFSSNHTAKVINFTFPYDDYYLKPPIDYNALPKEHPLAFVDTSEFNRAKFLKKVTFQDKIAFYNDMNPMLTGADRNHPYFQPFLHFIEQKKHEMDSNYSEYYTANIPDWTFYYKQANNRTVQEQIQYNYFKLAQEEVTLGGLLYNGGLYCPPIIPPPPPGYEQSLPSVGENEYQKLNPWSNYKPKSPKRKTSTASLRQEKQIQDDNTTMCNNQENQNNMIISQKTIDTLNEINADDLLPEIVIDDENPSPKLLKLIDKYYCNLYQSRKEEQLAGIPIKYHLHHNEKNEEKNEANENEEKEKEYDVDKIEDQIAVISLDDLVPTTELHRKYVRVITTFSFIKYYSYNVERLTIIMSKVYKALKARLAKVVPEVHRIEFRIEGYCNSEDNDGAIINTIQTEYGKQRYILDRKLWLNDGRQFVTYIEGYNGYYLINGAELTEIYDNDVLEDVLLSETVLSRLSDAIMKAYFEESEDFNNLAPHEHSTNFRLSAGPEVLHQAYNGHLADEPRCLIDGGIAADRYLQEEVHAKAMIHPVIQQIGIQNNIDAKNVIMKGLEEVLEDEEE